MPLLLLLHSLPEVIAFADTRGGRSWKASTAATRSSTTPSRRSFFVAGIMVVLLANSRGFNGWVEATRRRRAFQDCGISGSWLPAGKLPVNVGRKSLGAKGEYELVRGAGHADRTAQCPHYEVNSSLAPPRIGVIAALAHIARAFIFASEGMS